MQDGQSILTTTQGEGVILPISLSTEAGDLPATVRPSRVVMQVDGVEAHMLTIHNALQVSQDRLPPSSICCRLIWGNDDAHRDSLDVPETMPRLRHAHDHRYTVWIMSTRCRPAQADAAWPAAVSVTRMAQSQQVDTRRSTVV